METENTDREDFPVGNETTREPETAQAGLYPAVLNTIRRVAKTAEDIAREAKMFGKEEDKIDAAQYHWDFSVPGFTQTLRVYTGTFFGEKAKATDVAAALLGHRPAKNEHVSASQLWDKPCQVLVEFDAKKGRNKITKVMPPKRTAAKTLAGDVALDPQLPHTYAPGPSGRCVACGAADISLIHAVEQQVQQEPWGLGLQQKPNDMEMAMQNIKATDAARVDKLAAAATKMAGASEPEPPDDAYMQALAEREEADAAEA